MPGTLLKVRNWASPNEAWLTVLISGLEYGFGLGEGSQSRFIVSSADANLVGAFPFGALVTLERKDGRWPWVGYITQARHAAGGSHSSYQVSDLYNALLAQARAPMSWTVGELAVGEILRLIFDDAKARAKPPLPIELAASGGPVWKHEPRGERLSSILRSAVQDTGWEWDWAHSIGRYGVRSTLRFREQVGQSYQVTIATPHVRGAELTLNARGFLGEAVAVMGDGAFAGRAKASVGSGPGERGVQQLRPAVARPTSGSPALQRSAVYVNTQAETQAVADAAARRLYDQSDEVGEQLSMELVESRLSGEHLDAIGLGNVINVDLKGLVQGVDYKRRVRIIGIGLGQQGIINLETRALEGRRSEYAAIGQG